MKVRFRPSVSVVAVDRLRAFFTEEQNAHFVNNTHCHGVHFERTVT